MFMSYEIKYKRIQNDEEQNVIYKEIVSNQQFKRIQRIPWIEIISVNKSNKPASCNSLS